MRESPDLSEFPPPASFVVPERIVETASLEHAPFAFWLVGAHKPRIFVELDTYCGDSLLRVCQAVQRLGLGTRCYAVDTWPAARLDLDGPYRIEEEAFMNGHLYEGAASRGGVA